MTYTKKAEELKKKLLEYRWNCINFNPISAKPYFKKVTTICNQLKSLKAKIEGEGIGCETFIDIIWKNDEKYEAYCDGDNLCPKCQGNQQALDKLNEVLN